MLLRTIMYSEAFCDALVLQSPWIPVLKDHEEELLKAIKQKKFSCRYSADRAMKIAFQCQRDYMK